MKTETEFTVDYFIEKFGAIPEGRWTTGVYRDEEGRCCALGLCGARGPNDGCCWPLEASKLSDLVTTEIGGTVTTLNDDTGAWPKLGGTPKSRILNALRAIKERQ